MIEGQMVAKDILKAVEQEQVADPSSTVPQDELPTNDEEMQLYMQLNYKPAIELAEEEAISTVFEGEQYDDVRKRLDMDTAVLGMAVAKHSAFPGSGVKIEYVDPATVVHSYTESPNFEDCFYWGEVKTVPVNEIRKIDPSITNAELEEIAESGANWHNYHTTAQHFDGDVFERETVSLLYYNYKTTKTYNYKKKYLANGGTKIVEKGEDFNPPAEMMEEGKFEKITKTIDVWYSGVMVLGTNKVISWRKRTWFVLSLHHSTLCQTT